MENYRRARRVETPSAPPFPGLPAAVPEMKVRDGSKIRNLLGFALGRMEQDSARQILFTGSGRAVSKTIACVEIMKRRLQGLHQVTRLLFQESQEIWEPLAPEAGLDALTVKRSVPAVCVLLSKDALDPQQPGYQAPGSFDAFWSELLKAEPQGQGKRKQGGGGGRGGGPRREASQSWWRAGRVLQKAVRRSCVGASVRGLGDKSSVAASVAQVLPPGRR